ncbi:DUF6082 family protein [Streptomyces sp. MBT62]|uniref:DUF6082 family protein n=1 Tax=Streptomyces sp. MBT62 TaxID=2800410 RepID=UPI00190DE398|nr:DUF6082 family protein [Streptomyces sp. MBT62]MBK3570022.1 hypothetical protein [Streptomyces sp. MBT62]
MAASDQGGFQDLVHVLGRMADGLVQVAEEMRRVNLIHLHRLFIEQLDRAVDDPLLAAATSTLEGISEGERRQMIFANRHYGLILLAFRVGVMDRDELLGNLKILSLNVVFAEYWQRTREHRRLLPEDSLEARVGRAVDVVMEQRFDDLEEWWVVDG